VTFLPESQDYPHLLNQSLKYRAYCGKPVGCKEKYSHSVPQMMRSGGDMPISSFADGGLRE
jgi:hypothetical protein